MNVRVVYDSAPIRHIAVECPVCKKWFYGRDIADSDLFYDYEINFATFTCPKCEATFARKDKWVDINVEINIKEVDSAEECYDGCLQKKEVWE